MRSTDARIIAATHQPLEALVEEGSFREDLYFRLRVVEMNIPPLRDRMSDLPLLIEALLARIRRETSQRVDRVEPAALAMMEAYDWPGNVRELENALTRAALVARGRTLSVDHLRLGVDRPGIDEERMTPQAVHQRVDPDELALANVIAEHVQFVIRRTEGNKSEAARLLGISRSRLQRYVDRFDLNVPA
jgi:DNA-binding NtrC family response regulator